MFKRILVPTDGSDITGKAVDTAIALAKSVGAQLYTISVKEPFPYSAISEMQPTPPLALKASAVSSLPESWQKPVPSAMRCSVTRDRSPVASLIPTIRSGNRRASSTTVSTLMSVTVRPGTL